MPIMALEGHEGDIFATKFHPEGDYLASSGFDRKICMYNMIILHLSYFFYLNIISYMECLWRM